MRVSIVYGLIKRTFPAEAMVCWGYLIPTLKSQLLNFHLCYELADVELVVKINHSQYIYVMEIGNLPIRAPLRCPHEGPWFKIYWPIIG